MPSDLIHWDPKQLLCRTLETYLKINENNRADERAYWYWWLPLPTRYPTRLRGYNPQLAQEKALMVEAKLQALRGQPQYPHVILNPTPNVLLQRRHALQTEVNDTLAEIAILLRTDATLVKQHNQKRGWLLAHFFGAGQGDLRMQLEVLAQTLAAEFRDVKAALTQAGMEYSRAVAESSPPPYEADEEAYTTVQQPLDDAAPLSSLSGQSWLPMAWSRMQAFAREVLEPVSEAPTTAAPTTGPTQKG